MDALDVIFAIGMFCVMVTLFAGIIYVSIDEINHTHINITGVVTDKYEHTYTTVTMISNGKTVTCMPISHHDYVIVTDQGNLTVERDIYEQYNNGSWINLTKDVNDSSIMYNGGI